MNDKETETDLSQAWRAMWALCIGFFMILLDSTIVTVAMPDLMRELDTSLSAVVWVTSVYLLTFAVPLLVTGRLGDRFGQRNMYILGMIIFTLSSLACGLSQSIGALIAARTVQGLGASLLTPQTMSVINHLFPPYKRGAAMGMWGSVAGLAGLAGPVLGGILVTTVGWEWIFFINVPIGIIAVILVYLWVPTFAPATRRIHIPSVIISILSVFLIVFGLQEGESFAWSWWIWLMISSGLAGLALFIFMQKGDEDALLPLDIFKNKNFSLGCASIATMGWAISSTPIPLMMFLQQGHGFSAAHAGYMLIPQALLSGGLSPIVGKLADTMHPRTLSRIGFGLMVTAQLFLVAFMREGISPWLLLIPIILLGVGNAFVWSPNSATSMRTVPRDRVGAASGVYNTTRQVGSVVGAAVISVAMQIGVARGSFENAMGNSVIIVALVLMIGFICVSKFTQTGTNSHR